MAMTCCHIVFIAVSPRGHEPREIISSCLRAGVSAVGCTAVLNFFGLAVSVINLINAGAEVNGFAVLHQELLVSCQLHARRSHGRLVGPNGGGELRSEAVMSAHDRMFDSAQRTLEICDLREPVQILGMRADKSLLSPVRLQC